MYIYKYIYNDLTQRAFLKIKGQKSYTAKIEVLEYWQQFIENGKNKLGLLLNMKW